MRKLGALNFSILYDKKRVGCELRETIDLAKFLEELGYYRYWLGEHHTFDAAHSSPELLIPAIAQSTREIRLGSAGVLVKLYSPLKIAKNFSTLSALFPGRIDLGLAAGRVDKETEVAMEVPHPYDYLEKVGKLVTYRRVTKSVCDADDVMPPPFILGGKDMEIWMLSNGGITSSNLAALHGLSLSLAFFLNQNHPSSETVSNYKKNFVPNSFQREPRVSIVVSGVCAKTESEARDAAWHPLNDGIVKNVIGSPERCKDEIMRLESNYDADEVIFLDLSHTYAKKRQSYQLLATALIG